MLVRAPHVENHQSILDYGKLNISVKEFGFYQVKYVCVCVCVCVCVYAL